MSTKEVAAVVAMANNSVVTEARCRVAVVMVEEGEQEEFLTSPGFRKSRRIFYKQICLLILTFIDTVLT